MKISFTMYAGKYTTFARHAFAQQVGKNVNISREIQQSRTGKLISAEVSNDGTKVDIVVEVDDAFMPGLKIW